MSELALQRDHSQPGVHDAGKRAWFKGDESTRQQAERMNCAISNPDTCDGYDPLRSHGCLLPVEGRDELHAPAAHKWGFLAYADFSGVLVSEPRKNRSQTLIAPNFAEDCRGLV